MLCQAASDQEPDLGRQAIDIRLGADHPVQQR
jgi:hypothetical protein